MCVLLHVILNGTQLVFVPIGILGKPLALKCERRLLVQWHLLSMQRDQFTQIYSSKHIGHEVSLLVTEQT